MAKNYVLIFDGSGSMMERKCSGNRRKIEVAKAAVTEWAKSIPEDANVGLVAFYENAFSRLSLTGKNRGEFLKVVNGITAGGGTPLGQAVNFAHAMLIQQARSQLGYGEYNIVVVTDGEANNPHSARAVRSERYSTVPLSSFIRSGFASTKNTRSTSRGERCTKPLTIPKHCARDYRRFWPRRKASTSKRSKNRRVELPAMVLYEDPVGILAFCRQVYLLRPIFRERPFPFLWRFCRSCL